jgi:hypothetical protein
MTRRSLYQRSGAVLFLIALSGVLFYVGKGHTLLLDTNAVTIDGKEYKSADTVDVSIDGRAPESMGRAERNQVLVGGPGHTITLEVATGGDRIVQKFRIPTFMDTAVVSVPAILGNAPRDKWISKFVPPPPEDVPAEQIHLQDAPAAGEPAAGGATPTPAAGGTPANPAPAEPAAKP